MCRKSISGLHCNRLQMPGISRQTPGSTIQRPRQRDGRWRQTGMWSCTETRCGMESGSKKSNGKYQSLAGFYFFGALLVIAVHAEIEWLALIGFLGAFGFSWWASRAWHREGDREPRRWGESVWQAAGRQGKGSSGGCTGFVGLWLTLWGVALLLDGMDWICALTIIVCGFIWVTGK